MFKLPVIALLLTPATAFAEAPAAAPSLAGSAVQMLLGLALVIALLIGGMWLLKKVNGAHKGNNTIVRIVAGTALGPRERVVVVELGQNWLVLGVTPNSINTLAEMPRQPMPPDAPPEVPRWLQRMLEKKNANRQR